jgi:hypothetical protein
MHADDRFQTCDQLPYPTKIYLPIGTLYFDAPQTPLLAPEQSWDLFLLELPFSLIID